MFQVALTLLAFTLKFKAEVKDLPGAVMHVIPLGLAAFVVTHEIAGLRAAGALNPAVPLLANPELGLMAAMALSAALLVNAAIAQTGKCEQLTIE
jgi:hypothetical protein